ncbi:MAG: hypothetical protein K0Q95_2940 [Bacteroidota bacterium]|jgi:putative endonuclease|nr:hypothetical protein [Bacteroidota bacterium]
MDLNKAYVYILSNAARTVLYIGVTGSVYTQKYNIHDLMYFEIHSEIKSAIKKRKATEGVEKRMED